jgi:hypothetical protein
MTSRNRIRSISTSDVRAVQYHSYDMETHLNHVDGVKSMYSGHAAFAKKKDSETIDTTVLSLLTAEFTSVRGGCEDSSAFKSDLLIKKCLLFSRCPEEERIILVLR